MFLYVLCSVLLVPWCRLPRACACTGGPRSCPWAGRHRQVSVAGMSGAIRIMVDYLQVGKNPP